ncbi:pirin family protein [Hirschia baltica]|uniref:Pirin domain protein n=1 Tax=Hirschia baltica (strain ATCC 49814 / DSM 5838 / IFAM 1418) TaxID=582402 RepID=C6XIJ6_HIRBI|nr:pirin family protein [Hirschia baltica]ACT60803.1 Pirin domain protein [Hirschia baltica ATCC 49814]
MSLEQDLSVDDCNGQKTCTAVKLVITPKTKDLGGFSVRRAIPVIKQRSVGPWIFFDHMGPATFPPGHGVNVRPHPHINLATVTYLFEGEILHRDSLGSLQAIRPGDINLMVAGSGIVHSERERPEREAIRRNLHGLQLWHALPETDEETAPAFYHYPDADIPALIIDGVSIRVMMGSAYGMTSPVKTFAETLYIEANLKAGQSLILPSSPERALYAVTGDIKIGDTDIQQYDMAILEDKPDTKITSATDARIALIGGEPLGKRHLFWNFASSRKDRLEQAKEDWKNKRFPIVPGDEDEFIPLPE